MNEIEFVALVFVACAFIPAVCVRYLVVPLFLRRNFRLAASPEIRPVDPAQRRPQDADDFFRSGSDSLTGHGFELLGDHAIPNMTERVAGVSRLFVNRSQRALATLLVSFRKDKNGVWRINAMSTIIRTDFADGRSLRTSNIALLQFRPSKPMIRGYRFVKIRDSATLHRVHEAIIERQFDGKTKDLLLDAKFGGDDMRFIRWQAAEEPRHLVETGYCYHDQATNSLRMTLKGVFLATWKSSWPWKQLRIRKRDRDADRILKQVGMNEYGQPLS
jgi:hypothetical protein